MKSLVFISFCLYNQYVTKSKAFFLPSSYIELRLDLVNQNFSAYQFWLKQNNLEDNSSEDDIDKSIKTLAKSYIGCMENLKEFEKSKLKN